MNIYNDIDKLPLFENACITIGSFDGVHKGHLKVINQLQEEAKAVNGTSIVITFYPHPKQVISFEKVITQLNTFDEKCKLLENTGIDCLVVIPFNKEFSEMTAENYTKDFLVETFHPKRIVIGYDHKFGKNRTGDISLLVELSKQYNYKVKEISEHLLNEITISSTKIRDCISNGQIQIANELLGYVYSFSGKVIEGNKIGRTIGFPTANIETEDTNKLLPSIGVYAVSVFVPSLKTSYKGMMNIGVRPTIGGNNLVIEVHLIDFDKMIYGEKLTVFIKQKIRDEVKFDSVEHLKTQLIHDKIKVIEILND
jgi:riboflavin kinase/FMN adenylyltransferase